MQITPIHSFPHNPTQMKKIQIELRKQIEVKPFISQIDWVCGVDLAYFGDQAMAVIVVMSYQHKQIVETVWHQDKITCEYIPGYLAFRELPIFLAAWEKLTTSPDLVFFDGNGMLHPQRMGLATHASFFIQKPTIGIAKNHFMGTYDEPEKAQGSYTYIFDQQETIGAVLRTQNKVKPIYVSIGNELTLQNAIDFSMHFVSKESRIPEITRQADLYTKKWKREMKTTSSK